jgi:hypothetical protein
MGFKISWMAAQRPMAEVLAALGTEPTGETGEYFDFPFSAGELPSGWTVIWSDDFEFFDAARGLALSRHFPLLSCWTHEGVMHTSASLYEDGREIWSVWHEGDEDPNHIACRGAIPARTSALIAAAREQQAVDEGVDYLSDVPLELAHHICGFKHDSFIDEIAFHELAPIGRPAPRSNSTASKRSWLARLLGR